MSHHHHSVDVTPYNHHRAVVRTSALATAFGVGEQLYKYRKVIARGGKKAYKVAERILSKEKKKWLL